MTESSFDLSAAALAAADANLSEARRLREAADTRLVDAQAAKAAAVDAHSLLAGKMAVGDAVSAKETASAAATLRDSETHHALVTSAQSIALARENEALDQHSLAVFGHSKHVIAEKHRARAGACRALAASAADFMAAVSKWVAAGEDFKAAEHSAWSARVARLGPAASPRSDGVDLSKTGLSYAGAALPMPMLRAIREHALDHIDFMSAAAMAEADAERVAR